MFLAKNLPKLDIELAGEVFFYYTVPKILSNAVFIKVNLILYLFNKNKR